MKLVAALAAAVRMELVAALAAAVRMEPAALPAALARPAQTDRSCRNQGSRRSANGAGCCPCSTCSGGPGSTCSDRPQPPPQCACSDRPSLRNQGSHRSANGAPQCECTCPLPLLDLLRQTVAPQPGQPPQCEVRSRRSAAPFALRQPPAMAVAVARCGRIDRRMAALVSERAAVRTRPHLSQQAFRCVHPRLHRQLQLREPHVGGSCSECADRLVLLHEQHVTGSWTHTSAVAQRYPVTGCGWSWVWLASQARRCPCVAGITGAPVPGE